MHSVSTCTRITATTPARTACLLFRAFRLFRVNRHYRLVYWLTLACAGLLLTGCTYTPVDRSHAGYKKYQKVRASVTRTLKKQPLPDDESQVLDRELTWLAGLDYQWHYQMQLHSLAGTGVIHRRLKCWGQWPKEMPSALPYSKRNIRGLVINLVTADLDANPKLRLQPAIAADKGRYNYRQPLMQIAGGLAEQGRKVLAGINGGSFFISHGTGTPFMDTSCLANFHLNFEKPPYASHQVGNGLLVIDRKTYSYNCASTGPLSPPRSTFVQRENGDYHIEALPTGRIDTQGLVNALGAGPGLISAGKLAVRQEHIPAALELAANSALILGKSDNGHRHAVLMTVNGRDGRRGMFSFEMANFIMHKLKEITRIEPLEAMSMDQGGSTGLLVNDFGQLKVVSRSGTKSRPIYNALFIVE